MSSDSVGVLRKTQGEMIKSQIEKLRAAASLSPRSEDVLIYKEEMDLERKEAERRGKRKFASFEEEELTRTSRLNPSVVKLMLETSAHNESEQSSTESNDEESASTDQRKERKKKSKKEKKSKKHKSEKKDKKKKREKKSRRSASSSPS